MPKSKSKKRDENHNLKVAPAKSLSAKKVPVSKQLDNNLPAKNVVVNNVPPSTHSEQIPLPTTTMTTTPLPIPTPAPVPTTIETPAPASSLMPVLENSLPVKHPLNSKWTLWYYLPEKNKDWGACQHQIHTVETVEDFWSFFNHLAQPSELLNGVDYSFFKNDIRPMWEAPQNVRGGRLTVINTSKCRNVDINEIWRDVLMFLVGEHYDHAEDICGVVLNVRNYGIKIAIWTSHSDKERLRSIGASIRQNLTSPLNQAIPFEVHAETQKSAQTIGRASSKNVFTV